MLFKSKEPKVYVGVIKQISSVKVEPRKEVEMQFIDYTEKIVFLTKDSDYNTFYDIFTKQPYYGTKDISLKKGDYALIYSGPIKNSRGISDEILKSVCDEMNQDLEEAKKDVTKYKEYKNIYKI